MLAFASAARRRPIVAGAIVLLLVAAAGLTVAWFHGAGRLEEALTTWRAREEARGATVSHGELSVAGFPLSYHVTIAAPRYRGPDGFDWRGPTISGEASLLHPLDLLLEAPGAHEITLSEPAPATLEATSALMKGRLELTPGEGISGGEVTAEDLRVRLKQLPGRAISASRAHIRVRPGPGSDTRRFALDTENLEVRELADHPLGKTIAEAHLDATLHGLPTDDSAAALAAWREKGGHLTIHSFDGVWGPVRMTASGRLALDAALRPEGSLEAEVSGLAEALVKLTQEKMIERELAMALQLVTLTLSRESDSEAGRQVVDLPIELAEGWLNLGPVPVVPLPPVRGDRSAPPDPPR